MITTALQDGEKIILLAKKADIWYSATMLQTSVSMGSNPILRANTAVSHAAESIF